MAREIDKPTATIYKQELKDLYDPIEFDNSTLGDLGIVVLYARSLSHKPVTMIHIFQTKLESIYLESKLNERIHNITTRIMTRVVDGPNEEGREEQAQQDLDYLEEQVVIVLENNLSSVNWLNGYLDNNNIIAVDRAFSRNYYIKDIPLRIRRRVTVDN
ncbi:MAG: hypothetical protein ACFFDH_00075 [Promethearchaeota archaeon]